MSPYEKARCIPIPTHAEDQGEVRLERNGHAATLILSRPRYHNALTWTMYDELTRMIDELAADGTVRLVVLRGEGRQAFAAGTDITQFEGFDGEAGVRYEERLTDILLRLMSMPKPTVAAIEGYAVGGGLALAACCDLRYANRSARLGIPVARTLGNCLALETYRRLASLIGPSKVMQLIYTAELVSAQTAYDMGLVDAVFDDEAFDARFAEIAAAIQSHAPLTLWATKTAMMRLEEARRAETRAIQFDDVVRRVYGSDDFRRGVDSRVHKTRAEWQGR